MLREDLQLTGTKYGCGEGACGACSVLVDGKRIFSCSTPIAEVAGKSITTIEGIAHRRQRYIRCSRPFSMPRRFSVRYCTSGMIINSVALLKRNPHPTEDEICSAMNGNLCRCGTYPRRVSRRSSVRPDRRGR